MRNSSIILTLLEITTVQYGAHALFRHYPFTYAVTYLQTLAAPYDATMRQESSAWTKPTMSG